MRRLTFWGVLLLGSVLSLSAQNSGKSGLSRTALHGVYVIAHRGAHNGIPENSLPAYRKAIDLGCDFVEVDVRTTRDGKFVSLHNATIDQYVDGQTGRVSDMTLDELRRLDIGIRVGEKWRGTQVPVFEEILQLCRGKIGIYLDLKEAPVPELVELIRKYGMEREVIWYLPASRLKEIEQLRTVCPECVPLVDPGAEKNVGLVLEQVKTPVLATDMGELTRRFVRKAHRRGAMVFADEKAGTVAEWSRMIGWKTDGIQTDRPEELIRFLKQQQR